MHIVSFQHISSTLIAIFASFFLAKDVFLSDNNRDKI